MRSTQQVWRVRKQVIRKAARRESNSFGTPNSRELAEEFFLNAAESWRKGHPYNGSFKEYALTSIYHDFVDHHRKCEREAVEILTTRVPDVPVAFNREIGRASCRERV